MPAEARPTPHGHLDVEVRLDQAAAAGDVVFALAGLLLERARRELASREAAGQSSPAPATGDRGQDDGTAASPRSGVATFASDPLPRRRGGRGRGAARDRGQAAPRKKGAAG
jgi:hypothetical protein